MVKKWQFLEKEILFDPVEEYQVMLELSIRLWPQFYGCDPYKTMTFLELDKIIAKKAVSTARVAMARMMEI